MAVGNGDGLMPVLYSKNFPAAQETPLVAGTQVRPGIPQRDAIRWNDRELRQAWSWYVPCNRHDGNGIG